MDDRRQVVERALGYPFAVPSQSFALAGERVVELAAVEVDRSARLPLLAYGSNASPQVLARKLGAAAAGSVPATLQRSPGTEVPAFVAYLTAEQLSLISSTEPNYELRQLRGLSCRLEAGETLSEMPAFLSRH